MSLHSYDEAMPDGRYYCVICDRYYEIYNGNYPSLPVPGCKGDHSAYCEIFAWYRNYINQLE